MMGNVAARFLVNYLILLGGFMVLVGAVSLIEGYLGRDVLDLIFGWGFLVAIIGIVLGLCYIVQSIDK
jgi:hypothetical protein